MGKLLAVSLVLFLAVFTPPSSSGKLALRALLGRSTRQPAGADRALPRSAAGAVLVVAATFPDQIDAAAVSCAATAMQTMSTPAVGRQRQGRGTLPDRLGDDGRQAGLGNRLGEAYANQSTDVMASIQRLRAQARSAGNLVTTPQLQVVDSGGEIELWPAQPQYLFVPVRPAVVFFSRAPLSLRAFLHRSVAQL